MRLCDLPLVGGTICLLVMSVGSSLGSDPSEILVKSAGGEPLFVATVKRTTDDLFCEGDFWKQAYVRLKKSINLMENRETLPEAKIALGSLATDATLNLKEAMKCAVGVAAIYRVLTHAYCGHFTSTDDELGKYRANNLCLRQYHLAMNFLTEAFVKGGNRADWIDASLWPITLQELITEGQVLVQSVGSAFRLEEPEPDKSTKIGVGHPPAIRDIPKDARAMEMKRGMSEEGDGKGERERRERPTKIEIVSLCAYPEGHLLPKFSIPNKEVYAALHGYGLSVGTKRLDASRPHAWGKIQMMKDRLRNGNSDWYLWVDCDSYIMDLERTLDSLILKYAGRLVKEGGSLVRVETDPSVDLLLTEDSSMLNTGLFFMRPTERNLKFLDRVWGDSDSPFITHPWWENAAMAWDLLGHVGEDFALEDHSEQMRRNGG
eukprot:Cvel_21336.t1-p1 / transcript=Cvel_21336.t1 / gene=Cvel_21336 / organism=Chromera_velia_CCMP2878 / gene_product=Probable alpha-1,6-mannosyltransferase MNN10, putative / transcript_product=Probable alpha-1,6-mannosyltransferase MNN10, putative / location=Cvel_scaffold1990:31861-35618(+) / protein_length=432 / sequence_SO=supercontig / SO=protein_coding / is_pseudo=false